MSNSTAADEFLKELTAKINHHDSLRRWDAFMHQALIIVAAFAGCAALVAGLYFKNAEAAGIIAVIPSVCTFLIQNLHCVRARNWHEQMATEVSGIRKQLQYEIDRSKPDEIAKLSKSLRELETKMVADWAKMTNAHLGNLELKAISR